MGREEFRREIINAMAVQFPFAKTLDAVLNRMDVSSSIWLIEDKGIWFNKVGNCTLYLPRTYNAHDMNEAVKDQAEQDNLDVNLKNWNENGAGFFLDYTVTVPRSLRPEGISKDRAIVKATYI